VGTRGEGHGKIRTVKRNSQVRNANTYGVLRLTLGPTSYDRKFVPVGGKSFTDSGSSTCRR
jgi:acid phosphatase type 7